MGSYFFEVVKKGELFEGVVIRGRGAIRGNTVIENLKRVVCGSIKPPVSSSALWPNALNPLWLGG